MQVSPQVSLKSGGKGFQAAREKAPRPGVLGSPAAGSPVSGAGQAGWSDSPRQGEAREVPEAM